MAIKELSLDATVMQSLSAEFAQEGSVYYLDDRISVILAGNSCQKNFGAILRRIHLVVDERCPIRNENLFILVQDESGSFQNWIKIWKSV